MSGQRLFAVLRQDLRRHLSAPIFWILLLLVFFLTASLNTSAMLGTGSSAIGGVKPFMNSQYALSYLFIVTGFLGYLLFSGILSGLAVVRDDEAKLSELLHSTPLRASEYILGKLGGALAALALALTLQVAFAMAILQLGHGEDLRGPFSLANYLVPALLFAVPQIWFVAVLSFAVGERTRRPLVAFLVPSAMFLSGLFFFWSFNPSWLPASVDRWLQVLDPSAFRWLRGSLLTVDRGAEFYNTTAVAYDSTFWLNRLWVMAVPLLAVVAAIRHCRRHGAVAVPRRFSLRWWRRSSEGVAPKISEQPLADLRMTVSAPGFMRSMWRVLVGELRELVAQPGVFVVLPLVMSLMLEEGIGRSGPLGAPLLVTAGNLAVGALEMLGFLLALVLLFFTTEAMVRDQTTRFDALLYSSPVGTAALLVGRSLAGAVVAVALILGCLAVSATILAFQEGGHFELWPLLVVWGPVLLPTYLVWNAFVVLLFALLRNRYLTYAAGISALVASVFAHVSGKMTWLTNWDLWGTIPWTDLGPFAFHGRGLLLNRLLMVSLALLFTALAVELFARRQTDVVQVAQRRRARALGRRVLRLAPVALLPVLASGVLAYEIRNGYQGPQAEKLAKQYWRQNYATWKDYRPPAVSHVDLDLDLDPAGRSVDMQGFYSLVNDTPQAMERLAFTVGQSFENIAWRWNGEEIASEDRSGLHVLTPPQPLEPGGEGRLDFSFRSVFPRGVSRNGGGASQFVLPSGVLLSVRGTDFIPLPGYLSWIGVDRENRPEPAEVPKDFWRQELEPISGNSRAFTTRVEVTAPSEYTVNSVGVKTAARSEDGQTTVVWESDYPVRTLNLIAGRWEVRRQGGAAIFYHPTHDANVDEMLHTLAQAREKFSQWFFPYPWEELRISEYPAYLQNAQGFPTNIPFSESLGFLTKSDPHSRLASLVTAHEAAHQWWFNLLVPGEGPGADVLIEGMAHFSALVLLEDIRGPQGRIETAKRFEERYVRNRRLDSERPLVETEEHWPGDETVIFEKGGWALWMLHDHLGPEASFAGIRAFVERYHESGDYPALHDYLAFLEPYAADRQAFRALVDQWFFEVVLPEYRLQEVEVVAQDGSWQVQAVLENVGTGRATVEVAAEVGERFAEEGFREGRTAVELGAGERRRLSWTVPFEPQRLVVDPEARVLQLQRSKAMIDL
ncbi:MAG: ABC transporter permease subunit [Acidobacteriota bacterium]